MPIELESGLRLEEFGGLLRLGIPPSIGPEKIRELLIPTPGGVGSVFGGILLGMPP